MGKCARPHNKCGRFLNCLSSWLIPIQPFEEFRVNLPCFALANALARLPQIIERDARPRNGSIGLVEQGRNGLVTTSPFAPVASVKRKSGKDIAAGDAL